MKYERVVVYGIVQTVALYSALKSKRTFRPMPTYD